MSASITAVNVKLIANGQAMITEFKRAEAAAAGAAKKIDGEMDKLVRSVKRKFTASEFGKDLLKGFGVGSAFGVVSTGADMVQDYFARRTAADKEHEASLARQAELAKDLARVGLGDDGQLAAARADAAEALAKLQAAQAAGSGLDARKRVDELTEAYAKQTLEVAKLETAARDRMATEHIANMDRAKAIDDELRKLGFQGTMDPLKVGATQRSLAELRQARDLMAIERKSVRANFGMDAAEQAQRQINLGEKLILTQTRINELTAEHDRLATEVGGTIAGVFEEASFSGGRFGDVLRGLGEDLLRLALRESVTGPLAGWIGGIFKGFLPGRAAGGPVAGGSPYLVGERGPELFVPGTSGRIVPNHAVAGATGGNIYQIDARGTDESVVQRLSAALMALAGPGVVERRALSAHAGTLRRGGGAARALGA